MTNNQLYPYDIQNKNDDHNNINYFKNQLNIIKDGTVIVRQTFTYQRKIISGSNNTKGNNKIKQNCKNKIKQHATNQKSTNDKKEKRKKKTTQNSYKVDIKSPKNNNCNYIITTTTPNTEIVSVHKDIYNEYHEDIHKLFGRVEFHMKNNNINAFHSYWTEILRKFNYIYNIYNGNNGIVDQYSMEKTFKELHDKMTSLTKK